jgi:hypothetical protein
MLSIFTSKSKNEPPEKREPVATAAPRVAKKQVVVAVEPPPAPTPGEKVELRGAPRLDASHVPSITGVRISPYGAQATLVNISETGILVECSVRMQHGNAVTVNFEGTFAPRSVEGRVARHCVAAMGKDGALRYHTGIAFNGRIRIEDEAPSVEAAEPPQPEPAAAIETVAVTPPPEAPVARNRW